MTCVNYPLTSLQPARPSEDLWQPAGRARPALLSALAALEDEPVPLLLDLLLLLQRDAALDLPRVERGAALAQVTVVLQMGDYISCDKSRNKS